MDSDRLGLRRKINAGQYQESGLSNNEIMEMGGLFEGLTAHKGWPYLEAYILKHSDPISLLFGEDDPVRKGEAKGLIKLMQYVDQIIKAKNDLAAKEKNGADET